MPDPISVAIIQHAPVFLDLGASVKKAIALADEAARNGAQVIVFGETWLPGYPAWLDFCPEVALWDHQPSKEVFARLRRNSVVVPGPETEQFARLAADRKITLIIGANERIETGPGNGTLYNSLLTFTAERGLTNHHRKLVPTYTERMVWGLGDNAGLRSVATPQGRIGGLICWEHWMPLARQALHLAGEQIHLAVWPTVHEMHQLASRHYAFEGRCFVLAAGLIMQAKDLPNELSVPENFADKSDAFLLRGGSAIIGPNGKYVVEPCFDRETIVTAELDLSAVDEERMTLDVAGHYSRPDLFDFRLRATQPARE